MDVEVGIEVSGVVVKLRSVKTLLIDVGFINDIFAFMLFWGRATPTNNY